MRAPAWLWILVMSLMGCAAAPERDSVVLLASRKAEQALLAGVKHYEDGNYDEAERQLKLALAAKLTYSKDQAIAYKYLAFVYCGSRRQNECRNAFQQALTADPKFQLTASESGHPIWGPIFKSVQGEAGPR